MVLEKKKGWRIFSASREEQWGCSLTNDVDMSLTSDRGHSG